MATPVRLLLSAFWKDDFKFSTVVAYTMHGLMGRAFSR